MENLNLILFISIVTPLSMMLFICKQRSRRILFFLMAGILVNLFCGEVSGLIVNLTDLPLSFVTINITPTVEEICKAIPVLLYVFIEEYDDRNILECAIAVGVGFAVLENAFILSSNIDTVSIPLALIRGFGAGMMHGLTTLTVGYGMTFVHKRRKLFYTGTVALLGVAVMYHSLYNILVQSQYRLAGFILPILTFVPILIVLNKTQKLVE